MTHKAGTLDLIVLDYENMTVHYFTVTDERTITDEDIISLGFHIESVHWMCGDLDKMKHKGVLL